MMRMSEVRTGPVARVRARCVTLFGSAEAAETWLTTPAIGLGQRRPVDLFGSEAGMREVETYLIRIDYGVHS
jgi:putative toxin-antitoxin system antitoxin component (TIGR02293 family)